MFKLKTHHKICLILLKFGAYFCVSKKKGGATPPNLENSHRFSNIFENH